MTIPVRAIACGHLGTKESEMPLQNRVDPFGDIHAVSERGLFTGNRGVIHNPETRSLLRRRWTTKAWIVCANEYRGRKRHVMGRNTPSGGAGWTELFFLDEVTALTAGHRPCFYCRRDRAQAFAAACAKTFGATPRAPLIDTRLHEERLASGGSLRPLDRAMFEALPDGAMIAKGKRCFAKHRGTLRPWSFGGYGEAAAPGDCAGMKLITPATTIAALRDGYLPQWHPSIARVIKSGT